MIFKNLENHFQYSNIFFFFFEKKIYKIDYRGVLVFHELVEFEIGILLLVCPLDIVMNKYFWIEEIDLRSCFVW